MVCCYGNSSRLRHTVWTLTILHFSREAETSAGLPHGLTHFSGSTLTAPLWKESQERKPETQ